MTYPTPLNELLSQAALFGVPVFLGLLIAIFMIKRGTCWLAFLSGVAVQICLNYIDVRYFKFWGGRIFAQRLSPSLPFTFPSAPLFWP